MYLVAFNTSLGYSGAISDLDKYNSYIGAISDLDKYTNV